MSSRGNNMNKQRNRLIRLIHIAQGDLQMDDETYRAMLCSVGGADSTKNMPVSSLEAVLKHMKKAGFKVRPKAQNGRAPLPLADGDTDKKIRALWLFLHKLGAVKDPSERALFAYVKRMTGIDALQWTDDVHARRVIETLKKWAQRFLPAALKDMADQIRHSTNDSEQLAQAQEALTTAAIRQSFDSMWAAYAVCSEVLQHGNKEVS